MGQSDMGIVYHTESPANASLISLSSDAVNTLAKVTRGYSQVYTEGIGLEEKADMLDQLHRTALKGPLEFIQTIWLIKGVTRSFTHQLVRYRIGTQFVQESLRFSEKAYPEFLVPAKVAVVPEYLAAYKQSIQKAMTTYNLLIVDAGISVEDARGLLPHSILTSVFFGCSLATFCHIFEQRTCCQAQHGEWTPLVKAMREQLPPELAAFAKYPWQTGRQSCGFGASFDRPCKYATLFEGNNG
jgi:thymidylate synthase ThyX